MQTFTADCDKDEFKNNNNQKSTLLPCSKNTCFIKLKQVLNYMVHNLGKQPQGSYFVGSYVWGFTVKTASFWSLGIKS